MARDRQRAKQRRAERRSGGDRDPFGRPSAEVDEARLAEAGALRPDAEDDDGGAAIYDDELSEERERAPDATRQS